MKSIDDNNDNNNDNDYVSYIDEIHIQRVSGELYCYKVTPLQLSLNHKNISTNVK